MVLSGHANGDGGQQRQPMSYVSGPSLVARIVWYRGKAKITRALRYCTTSKSSPIQRTKSLPHEIVETIIEHCAHHIPTLKACSLTCYSWYITILPHIHHTLVLRGGHNSGVKRLTDGYALGLFPFVKELQIRPTSQWFSPRRFFSQRDSGLFYEFTKLQSLTIYWLDITAFISVLPRHFGHLSKTLRSLTLVGPLSTSLQLYRFISLFTNLDDISIRYFLPLTTVPDVSSSIFTTPKLQGKLVLVSSESVRTWELLAALGSLQFRSIQVSDVPKCVPVLLAACAETLETFRIEPLTDAEWNKVLVQDHNLSQLKVLRTLQINLPSRFQAIIDFLPTIEWIFNTITSPVFSELTFLASYDPKKTPHMVPKRFFATLRRMYDARPFKLTFLFVTLGEYGESWGRDWRDWVSRATDKGLLSFLEYPPSVRLIRDGVAYSSVCVE